MIWRESYRADPRARQVADRHYSRQSIGAAQFVPPGRCMVLFAESDRGGAYWVTSWPFAEYVKHRWPGAWVCSAFRNEGAGAGIQMIIDAVAATRHQFGDPPELGMVTFVDPEKVAPTMVRGEPIYGWTFIMAGFVPDGWTEGGLYALRLWPQDMPPARAAFTVERSLFE